MTDKAKKILGITGITLAVYLSMKYLLPAVAPFLIAFLLARWIYPLADRMEKKMPVNKGLITLGILLAGTAAVLAAGWFLGTRICEQIRGVVENTGKRDCVELLPASGKCVWGGRRRSDAVFGAEHGQGAGAYPKLCSSGAGTVFD